MSRLFVDVDDTLILWPKVSESRHLISGESAKPNPDVIEFVKRWKAFHRDHGEIIIWSLGGWEYAKKMTHEHAPEIWHMASKFYSKSPIPIERGDVFIDDDPLSFYRAATIHPDMLDGLALT